MPDPLVEGDISEQQVNVLKAQVSNLEKEKELMQREIDLEKRRGDINEEAFHKEKDLTDRALKLAESQKKSSVWEIYGPLGIIAIIVVTIASVF